MQPATIGFHRSSLLFLVGLATVGLLVAGCDSTGSSPENGSDVAVGFSSATSTSSASTSAARTAEDSLAVTGANGTLKIGDIRFIVSEVELEGDADSAEFETEKPVFVDLPLRSADVVSVVNGRVPPGTYNELEFEVEDADLEDEEELDELRSDIEDAGFANWPDEASLVAVGSFTPDGGAARAFTTFFDAEIEVEIEMEDRPFEIGGNDTARELTVNLSPSRWFVAEGGDPLDLSADRFQNAEEPVELEIEFEEESEIEFDD